MKQNDMKFAYAIEWAIQKNGYFFLTRTIQHALQFRFVDGSILNVFTTGKTVWQGQQTEIRGHIDELIADLRNPGRQKRPMDRYAKAHETGDVPRRKRRRER